LNLPNQITMARIFLVPVFMFFLLTRWIGSLKIGEYLITYNEIIAALIFIIAASTDGLDGYIARKRKLVTNLGKLLDPLADKLLVTAALISLVELERIPAWIAIVIISREFAVSGLRMIAASEGLVIAASPWGKLKTILQIIAIVALMLKNLPFAYVGIPFDQISIWAAVVVTILSGIDYFVKNQHVVRMTKADRTE
jgi:CDP-diacylglycerol--glycerol-3-phosphate 3-phosphatidyltransferase